MVNQSINHFKIIPLKRFNSAPKSTDPSSILRRPSWWSESASDEAESRSPCSDSSSSERTPFRRCGASPWAAEQKVCQSSKTFHLRFPLPRRRRWRHSDARLRRKLPEVSTSTRLVRRSRVRVPLRAPGAGEGRDGIGAERGPCVGDSFLELICFN